MYICTYICIHIQIYQWYTYIYTYTYIYIYIIHLYTVLYLDYPGAYCWTLEFSCSVMSFKAWKQSCHLSKLKLDDIRCSHTIMIWFWYIHIYIYIYIHTHMSLIRIDDQFHAWYIYIYSYIHICIISICTYVYMSWLPCRYHRTTGLAGLVILHQSSAGHALPRWLPGSAGLIASKAVWRGENLAEGSLVVRFHRHKQYIVILCIFHILSTMYIYIYMYW